MPWEQGGDCRGATRASNLPWSASQGGSQTTHAHTRANWAAGQDAKRKLQEVAARRLRRVARRLRFGRRARLSARGNRSQGYDLCDGRRSARSPSVVDTTATSCPRTLTCHDRHLRPVAGRTGLDGRGQGQLWPVGGRTMSLRRWLGRGRDRRGDRRDSNSSTMSATTDCGTSTASGQRWAVRFLVAVFKGFGIALSQKWVFDRRWGLLVAKKFYSNRPPGIHRHSASNRPNAVGGRRRA